MRKTVVLPIACLFALFSSVAPAQSGTFDVALRGQSVGTASFRIAPSGKALASQSTVHVSMKGLDYALSKTEQLSPAHELRSAELSAAVNGSAVHLTAAPEAGQFLLHVSANGRATVGNFPTHAAVVFLPDFDPGALETLLALAAARNNRDLWVLLPKQSGDKNGSIEPAQLATYPDEKGTLDGKPIVVHHLIVTYAGGNTDLFSGPTNQLLQAELPQPAFALVRKGFVLTPPAKPLAPPPSTEGNSSAPSPVNPGVNAPSSNPARQ